jgi:hypothetical protein
MPQGGDDQAPCSGYPQSVGYVAVSVCPAGSSRKDAPQPGDGAVRGPVEASDEKECVCTVGWVLFGMGFLFFPMWIAALFVPSCTKSEHDRRAAVRSGIFLLVWIVVLCVNLSLRS